MSLISFSSTILAILLFLGGQEAGVVRAAFTQPCCPVCSTSFSQGGFGTDPILPKTSIFPLHASASEASGATISAGSEIAPLPVTDESLSSENPQNCNQKKSPSPFPLTPRAALSFIHWQNLEFH